MKAVYGGIQSSLQVINIRCGNLFTQCQKVVRKPIRYVTIHYQDRSGTASLRCKNRAEISDPFVDRSPIRYGFCAGAQAIRYSVLDLIT